MVKVYLKGEDGLHTSVSTDFRADVGLGTGIPAYDTDRHQNFVGFPVEEEVDIKALSVRLMEKYPFIDSVILDKEE